MTRSRQFTHGVPAGSCGADPARHTEPPTVVPGGYTRQQNAALESATRKGLAIHPQAHWGTGKGARRMEGTRDVCNSPGFPLTPAKALVLIPATAWCYGMLADNIAAVSLWLSAATLATVAILLAAVAGKALEANE